MEKLRSFFVLSINHFLSKEINIIESDKQANYFLSRKSRVICSSTPMRENQNGSDRKGHSPHIVAFIQHFRRHSLFECVSKLAFRNSGLYLEY